MSIFIGALDALAAAHAKELDKQRSKAQFQLSELERRMKSQRSSFAVEGQNRASALEGHHADERARLQASHDAAVAEYERRLASQAETEQMLLQKLSVLDGGKAEAELERQRYFEHMTSSAIRRMQNTSLSRGWFAWRELCDERERMALVVTRMRHVEVRSKWVAWLEACEEWAEQRRLLQTVAARLLRPALSASFAHWRRDWSTATVVGLEAAHAELQRQMSALEAAARRAREEAEERAAAASAAAAAEHARLAATHAAAIDAAKADVGAARDTAVERWQVNAARRMRWYDVGRGWAAWLEWHHEATATARRLRFAGARLADQLLVQGEPLLRAHEQGKGR